MPESPRDLRQLRSAIDAANEQIRAHAREAEWNELDQQRHTVLVGEWQKAVHELRAAEDNQARPAAA